MGRADLGENKLMSLYNFPRIFSFGMRDPRGSHGKEDSPLHWLAATLDCSLLMPLGNAMVYSHLPVLGKTAIEVFVAFSWGRGVY